MSGKEQKKLYRRICPDTGKTIFFDENGLVVEDYEEKIIPKRQTYESKEFIMIDQIPRDEFLKEHLYGEKSNLNFTDIKVMLFIESRVGYNNLISFTQAVVSDATGIDKAKVSKSFKKLLSIKYIIRYEPKRDEAGYSGDKRVKHFVINPNIIWRGKPKDRKTAITKFSLHNIRKEGNVVHGGF